MLKGKPAPGFDTTEENSRQDPDGPLEEPLQKGPHPNTWCWEFNGILDCGQLNSMKINDKTRMNNLSKGMHAVVLKTSLNRVQCYWPQFSHL